MKQPFKSSVYSRIIGTGGYLPEQILTNHDLAESGLDTSDEWIVSRTGIRQRHVIAPDQTTTSMALEAGRQALLSAGLSGSDLELIVVATSTPDALMPSTACGVQAGLNASHSFAFDLNAACSGFIYALSIADQYVRNGSLRNALVIGSDAFTRILDWTDRSTCVLFGDGAGAVVLQADQTPGILATHLHADGMHGNLLKTTSILPCEGILSSKGIAVEMQGRRLFKMAVSLLGAIMDETLKNHGLKQDAVDWLVPHQANLRIIQATAERLHLPMEKVIVTLDKHANTSAASVPLAFDVAVRDGRIRQGQTILFEAFGSGLAWGSALVIY